MVRRKDTGLLLGESGKMELSRASGKKQSEMTVSQVLNRWSEGHRIPGVRGPRVG